MINRTDMIVDPQRHNRIMHLGVQEPFVWPEEPGMATVEYGILEEHFVCILSYLPTCLTQCESSSRFRYTARALLECLSFCVTIETYFIGVGHIFVDQPLELKGKA